MDSLAQLELFGQAVPGGRVMVRFNPGIGAGHSDKVVTGGKKTKFGVDPDMLSEDEIVLSVVDNGTGFDVEEVSSLSGHYGLKTMERRIGELGGTMKIESSPGAGTRVIMRI